MWCYFCNPGTLTYFGLIALHAIYNVKICPNLVCYYNSSYLHNYYYCFIAIIVPDPGKGVCADPVNRGAILEGGGPGPPDGNKERQLSPDKGRGRT
jgi:hypothetical protein